MHGRRPGKAGARLAGQIGRAYYLSMVAGAADRQLRRVLVAVDLSRASERLVRRAALLPLAAGAEVELLHVLPAGMPEDVEPAARRRSEEKLQRLQRLARSAIQAGAPDVKATSVTGQPHVEIIRRSRSLGADLIVVGREGRKRLRDRLAGGSLARRVIRKGDVPVLVVALEPARPYHRPMVAVDLSDTSRRVVDLARGLLGPEGSRRLTLLHAYQVPFEGWLREGSPRREVREEAAAQLQRFRAGFGEDARRWHTALRKGDPRQVVLAEARRRNADLIVLGTHGRSGVSHALLGNVAEYVVSAAACDVSVTRPARFSFQPP